jgi:hypothetical protein
VRGVVYSSGPPLVSPWIYDEEHARRFLLHYAGGGTDYPFDVLARLAGERADVLRVVISDGDFLANARGKGALATLARALPRSRALVAFLLLHPSQRPNAEKLFAPLAADPRFRLACVDDSGQLAAAARRLADALLGQAGPLG